MYQRRDGVASTITSSALQYCGAPGHGLDRKSDKPFSERLVRGQIAVSIIKIDLGILNTKLPYG